MLAFGPIYAMAASIDMMLEIGPRAIEQRVMQLAAMTRDVLRRRRREPAADRDPHYDSPIVTARFEDRDARDLARELQARKVHGGRASRQLCGFRRISIMMKRIWRGSNKN